MELEITYIDPEERWAEKERARHADARAVATGVRTVEQLKRENEAFAFAPGEVRLRLDEATSLH